MSPRLHNDDDLSAAVVFAIGFFGGVIFLGSCVILAVAAFGLF